MKCGLLHDVAGAEKQQAFARQPVASGASGLLVVALDVLRQIVVDDEAHVRFVDAHAERDRRADHAHVVAQKRFLMFVRARSVVEAGVIRLRRECRPRSDFARASSAVLRLAQ